MHGRWVLGTLIVVLALAAGCTGGGTDLDHPSPGLQIAALDGDAVREADAAARRANVLLTRLGERCDLPPRRVGDMAVTTQRILREREAVTVSLRTILESVQAATVPAPGVDCAAAFAAYVQLRAG